MRYLLFFLALPLIAQNSVVLRTRPAPASQIPKDVLETFTLSAETVNGSTLSKVLLKQPAPGTVILIVYRSSIFGGDVSAVLQPDSSQTPLNQRTIVFTLPEHRPFTAEDVIKVSYKTLE